MPQKIVDELKNKKICAHCIGEPFLRALVEKRGEEGQCEYCDDTGRVIPLEDMADHVEFAFERHYTLTPSEPNGLEYVRQNDIDSDYQWEREGEPIVYAIMDAAKIPQEAASDIQEILADKCYDHEAGQMGEEGAFSSETHYEKTIPKNSEWWEGWRIFEKTLKFEARFFSRTAAAQLSELFDTIEEMRTRQGKSLIIAAGPDTHYTHLYRARVFQSDSKLQQAMIWPDIELGAPPSSLASNGRMNAKGVSVFYGATSISTALAEVRPPVGSKVAVARFEVIRPIKLLDLTALRDVQEMGSIFDPDYAYRLGRMMFLRDLSHQIVRPVMPDDQESEYLPTQAIADFLATEGKVPLDGILYPSVQVDGSGLNVVLFHKAAKCRTLEFPEDTKFRAWTNTTDDDEGPRPDYTVVEEVPPDMEKPDEKKPFRPQWMDITNDDERAETLSVDLESVTVHHVNAVQIDTTEFPVRRHRSTPSDFLI